MATRTTAVQLAVQIDKAKTKAAAAELKTFFASNVADRRKAAGEMDRVTLASLTTEQRANAGRVSDTKKTAVQLVAEGERLAREQNRQVDARARYEFATRQTSKRQYEADLKERERAEQDFTRKLALMREREALKAKNSNGGGGFTKRVMNLGSEVSAAALITGGTLAAAIPFANQATDKASDLNETLSKSVVILGDASKSLVEWSKTSADTMGLSRRDAIESASSLALLYRQTGANQEQLAAFGKEALQRAADVASLNNVVGGAGQVLEDLQSGLTGQIEPLRKYGVFLTDARLKAEAFAIGAAAPVKDAAKIAQAHQRVEIAVAKLGIAQKKYGDGSIEVASAQATVARAEGVLEKALAGSSAELTAGQKMRAAYSLFLKDTHVAQGDFARTSDEVANATRRANAQFDNAQAVLGQKLLPLKQKVIDFLGDLLEKFNSLDESTQDWVLKVGGISLLVTPFVASLTTMSNAVRGLAAAWSAVKAAQAAGVVASAGSGLAGVAGAEGVAAGVGGVAAAGAGAALLPAATIGAALAAVGLTVANAINADDAGTQRQKSERGFARADKEAEARGLKLETDIAARRSEVQSRLETLRDPNYRGGRAGGGRGASAAWEANRQKLIKDSEAEAEQLKAAYNQARADREARDKRRGPVNPIDQLRDQAQDYKRQADELDKAPRGRGRQDTEIARLRDMASRVGKAADLLDAKIAADKAAKANAAKNGGNGGAPLPDSATANQKKLAAALDANIKTTIGGVASCAAYVNNALKAKGIPHKDTNIAGELAQDLESRGAVRVPLNQAQKGDVVVYHGTGFGSKSLRDTQGRGYHVGIGLGGGKMQDSQWDKTRIRTIRQPSGATSEGFALRLPAEMHDPVTGAPTPGGTVGLFSGAEQRAAMTKAAHLAALATRQAEEKRAKQAQDDAEFARLSAEARGLKFQDRQDGNRNAFDMARNALGGFPTATFLKNFTGGGIDGEAAFREHAEKKINETVKELRLLSRRFLDARLAEIEEEYAKAIVRDPKDRADIAAKKVEIAQGKRRNSLTRAFGDYQEERTGIDQSKEAAFERVRDGLTESLRKQAAEADKNLTATQNYLTSQAAVTAANLDRAKSLNDFDAEETYTREAAALARETEQFRYALAKARGETGDMLQAFAAITNLSTKEADDLKDIAARRNQAQAELYDRSGFGAFGEAVSDKFRGFRDPRAKGMDRFVQDPQTGRWHDRTTGREMSAAQVETRRTAGEFGGAARQSVGSIAEELYRGSRGNGDSPAKLLHNLGREFGEMGARTLQRKLIDGPIEKLFDRIGDKFADKIIDGGGKGGEALSAAAIVGLSALTGKGGKKKQTGALIGTGIGLLAGSLLPGVSLLQGAGFGSGIGSLLGFAGGGKPPTNRAVMVGEYGPELAVFRSPADILNAPDTARAIAGTRAMLAGGGAGRAATDPNSNGSGGNGGGNLYGPLVHINTVSDKPAAEMLVGKLIDEMDGFLLRTGG